MDVFEGLFDKEIESLKNLLAEAMKWGDWGNSHVFWGDYPQAPKIREIGEKINSEGGIEAMREVYSFMESIQETYGNMLNACWSYVGEWMS
jgi:hypothetical protein